MWEDSVGSTQILVRVNTRDWASEFWYWQKDTIFWKQFSWDTTGRLYIPQSFLVLKVV